jgi:hypothetical protein
MVSIGIKRVEKKRVVGMLSMRYPIKPVVILCQGGIRIKGAVVEVQVVRKGVYLYESTEFTSSGRYICRPTAICMYVSMLDAVYN